MNPIRHHAAPTQLVIPESHPILGIRAMLPMVLHHPNTEFNERLLLNLLRHSFTLTLDEKLKLLRKIPTMSQDQVNQLTNTLAGEQEKFEFIAEEFPEDVAVLIEERMAEMRVAVGRRGLFDN